MGLKIETWNIAYRKRCKGLFNKLAPFTVINNDHRGWYADPFLFDYKDDTYLFTEYFSYKLNRGVISYSKYDDEKKNFAPFKRIIVEDFHLSYPVVFWYNDKIYMMPETSGANALFLYEAVNFPNEWKRLPAVMKDVKLVDTTPIVLDNKLYALTFRLHEDNHSLGDLLLLEYVNNEFKISSQGILCQDMSTSRPGGNFIHNDNKLFRISQDCYNDYGKAINIIKLAKDFINKYDESLIEKIMPGDIKLTKKLYADGIHTYNVSNDFEVVDLKFYRNSFVRLLYRVFK